MLFNSYLFLLVFLPITLAVYYAVGPLNLRLAALWLCLTSIVFYGWWNPQFVVLLAGSIAFNYAVSQLILHSEGRPRLQGLITGLGVGADLALLFHYKYFAALLGFLNDLGMSSATADSVILPLGISFFTFTQIGYLLDCKAGVVKERSLLSYVLFVTFFPHLIAGPILHHKEMMPQFAQPENYRFKAENLSVGMMLFVIGLAKKVLLADGIAPYADAGFAAPGELMFWGSWGASLCYALQLYFDFSGYSDMALGLAKMFGIRFPLNFNSPYKAGSIIEFWARWHMTLTRYLTAYLYYPVAMAVSKWRTERNLPVGTQGRGHAGRLCRQHHPAHRVHDGTDRHLARRRLPVPGVRPAARDVPVGEPRLADLRRRPQAGRRAPDGPDQARRLRAADLRRRAGGAGLLPREWRGRRDAAGAGHDRHARHRGAGPGRARGRAGLGRRLAHAAGASYAADLRGRPAGHRLVHAQRASDTGPLLARAVQSHRRPPRRGCAGAPPWAGWP